MRRAQGARPLTLMRAAKAAIRSVVTMARWHTTSGSGKGNSLMRSAARVPKASMRVPSAPTPARRTPAGP